MTLTTTYCANKRLWTVLFFFGFMTLVAQVKQPFEIRYQQTIKGDLTFIANNIVNRDAAPDAPEDPYDLTGSSSQANDFLNMQYIDIDSDAATFSSSSAVFSLPDPNCSVVRYAGLYWGAVYPFDGTDPANGRSGDFSSIKFRTPGDVYRDITADEVIFDGLGDADFGFYSPYICYKDVTDLLNNMADPQGEYTVANIRAAAGNFNSVNGGVSAGWTLVIVYENPTLPAKNIATFDGFAGIEQNAADPVDIPFSGFTTLPNGFPVRANLAVAALEGDNNITGDQLYFKANSNMTFTPLSDALNPDVNFFNSSISHLATAFNDRTPNSQNTLGWDTDLLTIDNPGNTILPNDETGAVLRATTSLDKYDLFFTALAVENIEPEIQITNTVEDLGGVNIDGVTVALGQEMDYVITFDNTGNDDGSQFTITNSLPLNVVPLQDQFGLPDNGDDISVTYDANAHRLIFDIPDSYVKVGDPVYEIRVRVKVLEDCYGLRDACSNILQNTVYATYRGVLNPNVVTTDPNTPDFSDCNLPLPGATNYIDLDQCDFERDEYLCGSSITLTAGSGYTTYQWQRLDSSGNFASIAGANMQSYAAIIPGTYRVIKTAPSPCISDNEIINVILAGDPGVDPFSSIADEVVTCSLDGSFIPQFYFCEDSDERVLQATFTNAASVEWQRLQDGCAQTSNSNCATQSDQCGWTTVSSDDTFTLNINNVGEYRLVVTYDNGCEGSYPFKAFDYSIDPVLDISYGCIGNTSGNRVEVSVNDPDKTDVLYNLDGGDYRFNSVFRNLSPGSHTITANYNGCIRTLEFEIDDIRPVELSLANNVPNIIDMGASGGIPPYSFYVNGEFQGSNTTYRISETGLYEIVVVDANGCESRAQIYLQFYDMEIPNFFSPDGDNLNDVWGPSNSESYPNVKTIIYDRYGRVVGEMRPGEYWDGTYNGSPMPTGDYWYVLKIDEGEGVKEYVGHFTLYR